MAGHGRLSQKGQKGVPHAKPGSMRAIGLNMTGELLCNRLDVPVTLVGGGSTNLGHFCGQKLVVFFCPADEAAAAAEIQAYRALASEFEHGGAWLVGIVGEGGRE